LELCENRGRHLITRLEDLESQKYHPIVIKFEYYVIGIEFLLYYAFKNEI